MINGSMEIFGIPFKHTLSEYQNWGNTYTVELLSDFDKITKEYLSSEIKYNLCVGNKTDNCMLLSFGKTLNKISGLPIDCRLKFFSIPNASR